MARKPHHPPASLDKSIVRALLFDVDGTLSDSDDEMVESLMGLLKPLRLVLKADKLHKLALWTVKAAESPGNWILEQTDRIGLDSHLARFLDRRAGKNAGLIEDFPMIAGVLPMLEALTERYPMAVVSARNEATTRLFLRLNNLERFFKVVVTSQTVAHTKPFPHPLLHAAEVLGVGVENCLMIGDTITDVRAARAAGAQSLSVLCGFGTEKELLKAGTQAILPSTSLLANYLL